MDGDPGAAWYPDPYTARRLRYWDGEAWTVHCHPPPVTADEVELRINVVAESLREPAPTPTWRDLTENRPGEQIRRKAVELRRARPVLTFLARLLNIKTDERNFRVGAEGEEQVARRLAGLDLSMWRVLHSVPIGHGHTDVDHVVIGPAGVFTRNTKDHQGQEIWVAGRNFRVNFQPYDYVGAAEWEAKRAAKLLSGACGFRIAVTPLIVVAGGSLVVKEMPRAVTVLDSIAMVRRMNHQPPILSAEAVEAVYSQARRSTTWSDQADQAEG